MTSPWTPDREELAASLDGQPRYRLDQLWEGLYTHGLPPTDITTLPSSLRASLEERFTPHLSLREEHTSDDGETIKWLWGLPDDEAIETVLMHYRDRSTVCVSSQAGCAMACGFCATGQNGYRRNLTVGEILEQVIAARASASATVPSRRLSNVVLMGMGEPFANYERVLTAVRRIVDDLGVGARHITISTIGLVPQILRFAEEGLQVGLAVSLHAADDQLRSELVPINRRHPIADLVAACQLYRERTGRRVSLEWAMIDGVNDRDGDADRLIDVATTARAHVNLIPLNPTPGWPTTGSPPDRVAAFAGRLRSGGVNVTVRANRGVEIDAACGQLEARARPANPVSIRERRGTHQPSSAGPY